MPSAPARNTTAASAVVGRAPPSAAPTAPAAARHAIVATAGHVDHGKSTLVRLLTGTDPDRLPAEKTRGLTIDLGFAALTLATAAGPLHLGLIDVPGHEDFVKNMVAGVGSIDVALLIVAADDGWMPQTEEHLHILIHLGVTRAVVALTKIDHAPTPAAEAALVARLRAHLHDSPLANAPIVPTSAIGPRGFDHLRTALAAQIAAVPPRPDLGRPRLWIDRAFSLRGIGTVVTGTLAEGILAPGQAVLLEPDGTPTRIRSLQVHGRDADQAGPGTRVALNLSDVAPARGHEALGTATARRGQAVLLADHAPASATFDVWLTRVTRTVGFQPTVPLHHGQRLRLHLGSASTRARLILPQDDAAPDPAGSPAQLRLEAPLPALRGDRLVLRDAAERATLAGAIVLDPAARRAHFRAPRRQAYLIAHYAALTDPVAALRVELAHAGALVAATALRRSHFSDAERSAAVATLTAPPSPWALTLGPWLVPRAPWQAWLAAAAAAVAQHHRDHPGQVGLPLAQLRTRLARQLPHLDLWTPLLDALLDAGHVRAGAALRRADHAPALPAPLEAAAADLRRRLARQPFDPPSCHELAPDDARREALRFLLKTGAATALTDDLVLLTPHYERARDFVVRLLRRQPAARVSEIRQALRSSRRVVVPLLEKLDAEGVTTRHGDARTLGPAAA